jgi:predicted ATPase
MGPGRPAHAGLFRGKSLITQSHGQSLMSYFESRYQRKGLYFLDEPETALSPKSQVELLNLIVRESGKGHAQFVIATHSPILMACPQALIYGFDGPQIAAVKYEDTDHYRIYKAFMADPHAFTGIEN